MNIYEVLQRLRLEAHRAVIEPGWDDSMRGRPSGGAAGLEERAVREACEYCAMPPEAVAAVVRAARRACGDEALCALLWHAQAKLLGKSGGPGLAQWPALDAVLGGDAGLFYVLAVLAGYPQARDLHRARAVPAEVVADTMSDVLLHMDRYRRHRGEYGLTGQIAGGWLTHHFRGKIFRLGRLQFMHRAYPTALTAFRGPGGRVRALSQPGVLFRRDGQKNGAAGITETEGVWTSTLAVEPERVRGNPLDPVGARAGVEMVELDRGEWRPALCPGDPVLDIHIPAIGPMSREACAESAARAVEFFPRHFPDCAPARALMCGTWMLDPQLAGWLPAESNIMQFQRQFYLHPVDTDAWAALRFVFELDVPYNAERGPELDALPQKTTLERALVAHARAGGRFYKAGGFILVEDLPWGREAYRS
jgi:hypothetical protein